jgi:hypothetical protein
MDRHRGAGCDERSSGIAVMSLPSPHQASPQVSFRINSQSLSRARSLSVSLSLSRLLACSLSLARSGTLTISLSLAPEDA